MKSVTCICMYILLLAGSVLVLICVRAECAKLLVNTLVQ